MARSDLYPRAKSIFLRICDASPADRDDLLDSSCEGDAALRSAVEAMLSHDEADDDLDQLESLAPGDRVGQYTIVRPVGAGAMGLVYEATQQRPQRTVALKLVRAGAASKLLRRRLEHEATALARLQHPGIAAVFEAGVDDSTGAPFVAMEFVRGVSLTRSVREQSLDIPARVELLATICDAVQHAHQRGVIHRDLKPSNILVDESGRARVLDFGIARVTAPGEAGRMNTLPGQVIGTLTYMSPEQSTGDPDAVDARADIYALGALAYEVLAGSPPLDLADRPLPEALSMIQNRTPARLGTLDRRLRGDFETIVATALEKDPARRYQSAETLAGDLRRALRNEPLVARAPTTLYQLRKFARRRRGLVAAAGAIATTLLAAVVVSAVFAVRAAAQRDRAEARFGEVRALANTLLFEMHDLIAPLAGSTEARTRLVETGLAYLDSLATEAADDPELLDPELLEELAEAYFRIGDIQGNMSRANLGQVDAALASYRRCIELRQRLAQSGGLEARLALIRTRVAIGETLTGERAADALEQLLAARSELVELRRRWPQDEDAARLLGVAERRAGSVLRTMGRPAEALPHYQAALALVEEAAGPDPDAAHERRISTALNELGRALTGVGRHEEALACYERSMRIRAAAAAAEPQSPRAQRDLALVHHGMASASKAFSDHDAALRHDELARDALAAIAVADAADSRASFDLSIAEERVAMSLVDLGRLDEALPRFQAALDLRIALTESLPDNLLYLKARAIAKEQVANCLRKLERHDESRQAYHSAIDDAQHCIEADTHDMRTWTVLAVSQRGLGEVVLAEAERAGEGAAALRVEAASWFAASLATLDRIEQAGMKSVRGEVNREQLSALLAQSQTGSGERGADGSR